MAKVQSIDDYIESLPDWRGEVVASARDAIVGAAPDATASIKWAQPVFEAQGPFAYIKAFPRSVNIGFWRGTELDDPNGRLEGDGDRMRHVKLSGPAQLEPKQLADWARQAVELNRSAGDPTKRR